MNLVRQASKPVSANTGHGRSIDRNEVAPKSEFTFRVAANKPFGIYMSTQRPGEGATSHGCGSVATFLPRAGAKYVSDFSYQPPRCCLNVEEVNGDVRSAIAVRYRRQMPTSMSKPTPWCSE